MTTVFGGTTAQRTNNNAYKNAETIYNTVKIAFIRKYWFYPWNRMIEKAGARSVAQSYIDKMERKRKAYIKKTT